MMEPAKCGGGGGQIVGGLSVLTWGLSEIRPVVVVTVRSRRALRVDRGDPKGGTVIYRVTSGVL